VTVVRLTPVVVLSPALFLTPVILLAPARRSEVAAVGGPARHNPSLLANLVGDLAAARPEIDPFVDGATFVVLGLIRRSGYTCRQTQEESGQGAVDEGSGNGLGGRLEGGADEHL